MGLLENIFIGLAVVTGAAAFAALAGWYYALDSYGEQMSDRARTLMTYGVPPAVVLSAMPVLDVVLWLFADFSFPTVGFAAPALGLVGGVAVVTYVALDLREQAALDEGLSSELD